jgi:uncharacterized OB-fold protein
MADRPWPVTDPTVQPEEEPFYDGLLAGELCVPWCDRCDVHVWRPKSHCTSCYQPVSRWRTLPGTGEVYSYCVVHRGVDAFAAVSPYVLAWVTVDDGPTILANLDMSRDEIRIGQRVRLIVPHDPERGRRGPVFTGC